MSHSSRTRQPNSLRNGRVIPQKLAARIRSDINAYLGRINEPSVLSESVFTDSESGWRDYTFEVKVNASLERRNEIWDDLCAYLDRLTDELPEADRHYRGSLGIWVRDYTATSIV